LKASGVKYLLLALMLSSCASLEQTQALIPAETIAARAPGDGKRLVIVLPGRGDDLAGLKATGIAAVIQEQMPDAEVVLVGLTFPYYTEGRSVQRLHEEIVLPARARGRSEVYLAGASMGGMGVLLYEREYPNQLSGLVLMAPYMGGAAVIEEIRAAGGLRHWRAGPRPDQVNGDNVAREEWRVAQSWLDNPGRAQRVWLICGQGDAFHPAAQLLGALLPAGNYIAPAGGHSWRVWKEGASAAFSQVARISLKLTSSATTPMTSPSLPLNVAEAVRQNSSVAAER